MKYTNSERKENIVEYNEIKNNLERYVEGVKDKSIDRLRITQPVREGVVNYHLLNKEMADKLDLEFKELEDLDDVGERVDTIIKRIITSINSIALTFNPTQEILELDDITMKNRIKELYRISHKKLEAVAGTLPTKFMINRVFKIIENNQHVFQIDIFPIGENFMVMASKDKEMLETLAQKKVSIMVSMVQTIKEIVDGIFQLYFEDEGYNDMRDEIAYNKNKLIKSICNIISDVDVDAQSYDKNSLIIDPLMRMNDRNLVEKYIPMPEKVKNKPPMECLENKSEFIMLTDIIKAVVSEINTDFDYQRREIVTLDIEEPTYRVNKRVLEFLTQLTINRREVTKETIKLYKINIHENKIIKELITRLTNKIFLATPTMNLSLGDVLNNPGEISKPMIAFKLFTITSVSPLVIDKIDSDKLAGLNHRIDLRLMGMVDEASDYLFKALDESSEEFRRIKETLPHLSVNEYEQIPALMEDTLGKIKLMYDLGKVYNKEMFEEIIFLTKVLKLLENSMRTHLMENERIDVIWRTN